jgi:single-stranded-DNA-specific exonuclease
MEPRREAVDWIITPGDRDEAVRLGSVLGLSPLAAQLLLNRGIGDPEHARRYLDPRLGDLRRPDSMKGFAVAVERLERALADRETVGVYGDYDVDGITSCAVLSLFLRDCGGRVVPRVAKRDAGYGFGVTDAAAFADAGCAVVVTCDCGTSDHEGLAEARRRGLSVIIVDHHQVPDREPEALALLNPHQPGCQFPFKGLASVGVAFYLAAALRTRLRARAWERLPDPRLLLDLVALGTVCDMAPLTYENRILVSTGVRLLQSSGGRPALRELARIAGLDEGVRRASDLGSRLGPRLNAPGRLGAAQLALDLLLAEDPAHAAELAEKCEDANRKRQDVQEKVFKQALEQAEEQKHQPALVLAGEGWASGVVGIVAAKMVDRFSRPAFVLAVDGNVARGSARSWRGFNLYLALKGCHDLLAKYGGHAAAAGLTVDKSRLPELRRRLCAAAAEQLGQTPAPRTLALDAEVPLGMIDDRFGDEITKLEPFGIANPEPCLGARDLVLERTRVVGDGKHLQVTLSDGMHACDGIGFHFAAEAPEPGARVRAAFVPEVDTWRGVRRLRVRLRDLQVSS